MGLEIRPSSHDDADQDRCAGYKLYNDEEKGKKNDIRGTAASHAKELYTGTHIHLF